MITGPDYYRATNAVYQILRQFAYICGKIYPRVDIYYILSCMLHARIISYTRACQSANCDRTVWLARSEHGFSIREKENSIIPIVWYNDWKDITTIFFTLAHEAGHIVLKHVKEDDVAEREANCFARNLLCPIYIRKTLGLTSVEDYCSTFHISEPMAEAAIDKTPLDYYHIDKRIYQEMNEMFERQINGCTVNAFFGA